MGSPNEGTWLPAWNGADYAANTAHHRRYDGAFLAATPLAAGDRVLDLGCGSGDFTAAVAALVPAGEVVGLDAQPSMLDAARDCALNNQSFVLGPVQALGPLFEGAEPFDVVLSRAALHWVPRAEQAGVYRAAARLVRPGGWLRVECGGAGNIAQIRPLLDEISAGLGGPVSPWSFLDAGEALALVEEAGLDPEADGRGFVRTYAQRRRFDRESFTGWLQSQCVNAYTDAMAPAAAARFVEEVTGRLDVRRADGTWDQTFVRLDLLAGRPGR